MQMQKGGKNEPMERMSEKASRMNFQSILQTDVPKGRDGKHKLIVTQLLSDLAQLPEGSALRIPPSDLPDSKENIRSALNRATRQRDIEVATSSDAEYLYVWKAKPSEA
jgi:hypothetical protein